MSLRHTLCGLLLLGCGLLLGCTAPASTGNPGDLVSRTSVSATEERIVVNGGGRDLSALVLLPDGYPGGGPYPLLIAVHNFAGDAAGFAGLIHAERLRRDGVVVVLPQAGGMIPEWQGPGITITVPVVQPDWRRVSDAAGLVALLAQARRLYPARSGNINLLGFSQGATLALDVTQRLDREEPGLVRRLFLAAGSLAGAVDASLALAGSDLIAYQPGHNGPQAVANTLTGEPDERTILADIVAAKGCVPAQHQTVGRVDEQIYQCRDDRTVTHIFEASGEHAWPGQDARFDSALMGAGSGSAVDFTSIVARAILGARPG